MSSIRLIKRRIKSAKNISQVTKALQMVSAVKMRRAQSTAIAGKPYALELRSVLSYLAGRVDPDLHPFLNPPPRTKNILVVVIGSDKGLAGSLITNLARRIFQLNDQIKSNSLALDASPSSIALSSDTAVSSIAWGKKSRDAVHKVGWPVIAYFTAKDKKPISDMVSALSQLLIESYLNHTADLILIAYSDFINTVTQKPVVIQFLPMVSAGLRQPSDRMQSQVNFEPSADAVLDSLLSHYQKTVLTQIIFDSQAAEHSARMVAMKNAYDNSSDIIKYLTLKYNQTRQTAITNEISDIISGSMN